MSRRGAVVSIVRCRASRRSSLVVARSRRREYASAATTAETRHSTRESPAYGSPPPETSRAIRRTLVRTTGGAPASTCRQLATSDLLVGAALRRGARARRHPVRGRCVRDVRCVVRPRLGTRQVDHAPGARKPRVPDVRRRRLLPLLRQVPPAIPEGLLQLRPRAVAPDRAELELLGRRRVWSGLAAGAVAAARSRRPPAACTLAYWHHPRFSSGLHGSDSRTRAFWQALYDAGADVVLGGHDHDYERFAAQTPSGDRDLAAGLREFVVGRAEGATAVLDGRGRTARRATTEPRRPRS